MKKYEIDYSFGKDINDDVVLTIYVGNPNGDLVKASDATPPLPEDLIYEWPLGWAPDNRIFPVIAFVTDGESDNSDPLEFVTSMQPDIGRKYAEIFVIKDDTEGETKRKRRTQVKVTSGGGL